MKLCDAGVAVLKYMEFRVFLLLVNVVYGRLSSRFRP